MNVVSLVVVEVVHDLRNFQKIVAGRERRQRQLVQKQVARHRWHRHLAQHKWHGTDGTDSWHRQMEHTMALIILKRIVCIVNSES